ncbi:hypothetical protein [Amycolatopsis vastitatis]|uniref:Uncharacterized protein n=1 Tax=Amycolatopsis vastitatis TaxID=1905142 RepID=A0A229TF14_9PSEU|nr:hypothetical protein [Amycolatopsis vastitatis]OXM69541.1 hypothetical protein CF165_08470 [Amycolatopsis vastitatis]
MRAESGRPVRWLRRIAVAGWGFSWYTVYREVFVWHHMTTRLRFRPPDLPPGSTGRPHPGLPLIAVCVTSVAAPLVVLAATLALHHRRRDAG